MNNTAPIGLGICAVAALFGLVGGTMLFVMWDYTFLGAAFMACIIAALVAIVLLLGWRPANDNSRDMAAEAHRAGQAPTVPASGGASSTPAATPTPPADPTPAAEPAPAATASPAEDEKPVIKSTLLPGETELSERKGDWKYESAEAAPAAKSGGNDGAGIKPATLSTARDGGPDNLKEIKGVGPKLETLLHSMGFYHFDQIAAWTADEIAWVDANLEGFKGRVSRDDWVAQAKILADGGDTEFSKKVDEGGVY